MPLTTDKAEDEKKKIPFIQSQMSQQFQKDFQLSVKKAKRCSKIVEEKSLQFFLFNEF